jgi:riboflavin synthase
MFTGIVEETGTVIKIETGSVGVCLTIECRICGDDTKVGDSIAVNGCCLTVVAVMKGEETFLLRFDLLRETWNRTNLQFCSAGSAVNLERALSMSDRMGGHFVTGHVEGLGKIKILEKRGADFFLAVEASPEIAKFGISKGSFTVDGISLTVAEVDAQTVSFWIIPHTFSVTNLRNRQVGEMVNLEPDLIGKYVEKFISLKAP